LEDNPPAMTMSAQEGKYVYYFGEGQAEDNAKMKDVLGGKGVSGVRG